MHVDPFDSYRAGNSLIHELDPRSKLLFTLAFIISTTLLPDGAWLSLALAFMTVLGISLVARLPLSYAIKRSLLALPFTLAALTVVFVVPGQPLLTMSIGSWTLRPTDAGLIRFVSIVSRSLISVQMAILLTATTPFPDLLHAMRHIHVPRSLVAIISFMLRYLFVLVDEALRLLRARSARSAGEHPTRGILWQAQIAGHMAGQLFVRSFERSDRIYDAMLARGYTGYLYTLHTHIIQRRDWLAAAGAVIILSVIQLAAHLP